jgi:uncharacterized membrane protein YozB (DUF420 family)
MKRSSQDSQTAAVPVSEVVSGRDLVLRNRRIMHFFHITAVVYMTFIVILGFWPTYFGQLFTGLADHSWLIHLHAAVFTGWLLLLLVQVSLVAAGKTRYHKKLGMAGAVYGVIILALGLSASIVMPLQHIGSGEWTVDEGAAFLILPLGDILLFTILFGAAVLYRKKIEIHKRFILAASVLLIFPAAARLFVESQNLTGLIFVWLSPMMIAMILDAALFRRIHPVYWITSAILLLSLGRLMIMNSEPWLRIGRGILEIFL